MDQGDVTGGGQLGAGEGWGTCKPKQAGRLCLRGGGGGAKAQGGHER